MKTTTLINRSAMLSAAGLAFLLVSRASLPADELTPGNLKGNTGIPQGAKTLPDPSIFRGNRRSGFRTALRISNGFAT